MTATTRRAPKPAARQPLDIDWRMYAACASTDPEVFFPVGHQHQIEAKHKAAKRVCAYCPVRQRCLEWALDTGQNTGVWGGLDEAERRRLARVPDSSMTVCLNAQAWIEEQLAADRPVRAIARDLNVDPKVLSRAIQRFADERALDTAAQEVAAV